MDNNNVIISLKAHQAYEGREPEDLELITEGQLLREPGGYTLRYQESALTGLEGTRTTIRVEGEAVTLLREGSYHSHMVFEPGRRHVSLYETPYGALEVGVHTSKLRHALTDRGGEIEVGYRIEVDHRVAGVNLFHIQVKEKPGIPQ